LKPRTVVTYNDALAAPEGVAFQWADISPSMKDDLKTNATGATEADAAGVARLDYLRGDRSNEGAGRFFRQRISMLADIVNSGPVFVGAPSLNWPDTAPFPEDGQAYSEFKNGLAANRKKMVYVGANDAMLHAFDDDTGEEVFTYVPSIISSSAIGEGLHYLTESNYGHQFYVDLTPTLSDAYISSGSSKEWHTILVGGLRGGGRGLFALNVTDPDLFQEANADKLVMWEFDSDDDSDLGFTYSRPFIAYTNAGTWVAIFGNGYNDLGSGEASLFIVDIEKGVDGIWQPGDYVKISTGAGDPANRNGLATPALADVDGNGTVDRVYAGDLEGNMWAFDLESTNQTQWGVAYTSGSTPIPLFTTPPGQPISAKPVLAKHPTQPDSSSPSNAPNIMVYFGTGQYLVDADKSSTSVQSFYGVWDQGDSALVNTDLIEQTFDTSFSVKVLTRNPVDYSIDHGWYFNLPETGERAVTSPIARADTVFFNSFVPVDDPCSVGGFGFKFAVDMATGGSPLDPSFDANKDGVIDDSDMVSNGIESSTLVAVRQEGFLPEPVFIEDLAFTAETATKVKALKDIPVGRFSWQELIQ
jgi:type IV pilus assembly protein PilY1